jgi:hypothetical protein
MFARPKDVPIINHPLILGLVRGVSVRTGRTAKEQRR